MGTLYLLKVSGSLIDVKLNLQKSRTAMSFAEFAQKVEMAPKRQFVLTQKIDPLK